MRKYLYSLFLFLFFLSSCTLNNGNNTKKEESKDVAEKEITMTRLWEMEIEKYDENIFFDGDSAFFIQGKQFVDEPYFYISKIDLITGSLIWNSEKIEKQISPEIVKCGDYIFVYENAYDENSCIMYSFNADDGTLNQTIDLGTHNYPTGPIVPYKNRYLIWSFWGKTEENERYSYVCLFDTNDIENPTVKLSEVVNGVISTDLLLEENENGDIVYFETMGFKYNGWHPKIGAIECESLKVKWIREIEESYWPCGDNSLLIEGNRLFAMDSGLVCLNKTDGSVIYVNLNEDFYSPDYSGSIIRGESENTEGMFYYDEKIFLTNTAGGRADDRYFKNIQCLNSKTGDYLWGDLPKKSYSLYSKPVVIDGKLLITMQYQGLRIYDASSGKFLGVDRSILTGGNDINPVNDNVLYVSISYDPSWTRSTLVALMLPDNL